MPSIISNSFYSTFTFIEFFTFDRPMVYPKVISTKILQTFSDIIPVIVSIVTLIVFLAIAIFREGRFQSDSRKTNAERGLLISSVVAYSFYMLYFINNLLARYLQFWFSGNAQFLFVGLAGITPFWCLIIFAPSVRRSVFSLTFCLNRKMDPLSIFDGTQIIAISISLVITIPIASIVYFKLLFASQFAENFAFKLIVVNGSSGILSTLVFLAFPQLTSFNFMLPLYKMIERNGLTTPLALIQTFLMDFSLHSALFVALNRIEKLAFPRFHGNDSVFFMISILISFLLSLPNILNYSLFTTTLQNMSNILPAVVSITTFVSNIFLAVAILRGGRFKSEVKKANVERGLIVSSVVAYAFYMLYFINNIIARVFIFWWSAAAQFLFLGLSGITPFCLIIFARSIRRSVFPFSFENLNIRTVSRSVNKFNAEKGLIITSVVAYVFYMLFFINNVFARYLRLHFSANAQFLFLGMASVTPFWCLILFSPSIRRTIFTFSTEISRTVIPAEIVFDWCQTIFIAVLLVITLPLSSFVYYKLLFSSPFSDNYTFKLIAVNGIAGAVSTLIYLFYIQLTSYHFMYWFYKLIERADLLLPFAIVNAFFAGMSIHTALFVALNRNDSLFFCVSILLSSLLSLPGVLDYCFFTTTSFIEWEFMGDPILFPSTNTSNPIFFTVSNILSVVVSVATLIFCLFRFNAERGLIFTSVSSYVFYTLYLINRVLAQYFKIPLFANAQFLFLGVARLSPVCLIIFAPSVRRSLFKTRKTITTPIQSTVNKMMMFSPGVYIGKQNKEKTNHCDLIVLLIEVNDVHRTALYCEGGIPKKLNREVSKWIDGTKTFQNQQKVESKKKVLLANGKTVEIVNRPKRQRETTSPPTIPVKKTKANDNGRKKVVAINTTADSDEQSDGDTVARDPSVGGNNVGLSQVNNTVEMSRKEKRRVERAMRQSSILTMDDDEDEVTVAPTLSRSFDAAAILDAVRMMEERLNGGLQNINKNLETMNRRIDRLEDQQDEIADSMETQRTLIREVATVTPQIAANAHKAAEGTDTITEMLPSPPPVFSYRFVQEPRVRELDEEYDDFLSFAAAFDREIFTASERSQPLSKRDKIRVRWMTEGNAQEDEEEVREESGEEEEVQEGRDETEGDESVRMDEMEEEGMNDGRMRGGSDMQENGQTLTFACLSALFSQRFKGTKERMLPALEIFDTVQTIIVAFFLFLSLPLASFVYFKLIFSQPFSENFTFKLIAVNGMTGLLNSLFYLLFVQLTSFTFMYSFFKMIERNSLETTITVINVFFAGLSLHSALFVAVNRLKTLLSQPLIVSFYEDLSRSSTAFVALNRLKNMLFQGNFGNGPILIPDTNSTNVILKTSANVIGVSVSVATLIVNITLAILITRARQVKIEDRGVERGLIITSVVSYVFYMLYFINNAIARYLHVEFCGNAQFIFHGLASLTPF
ncbi:hypothetical protein PRIPAC_86428, partial [Pristionchus pacificus]|uniref:Uncharacterized protein n=1 Tax=Pristionchus pacificus TaxID=54126 RepID=A0A2A6BP29_PRIPA